MSAFLLETDTRARRASKELKSLLATHSVEVTLRQSQDVLARMLGYADWRALLATVGTGKSAEDDELSSEDLSERHRQQLDVLLALGLGEAQAVEVRNRLSPTGRSEAATASREVVPLLSTYAYHPSRLLESMDSVISFRHAYARHNGFPSPVVTMEAVFDDIAQWVGDSYKLTPLDAPLVHSEVGSAHDHLATEIMTGAGPIIDVSAVAAVMALRDVSDETYAGAWDDMPLAYVHLGTNAFPSPFPGCGIEGCYVTIDKPSVSGIRRVELVFVASPEFVPELDIREDVTFRDYDKLIFDLRHVRIGVDAVGSDDQTLSVRLGDALGQPSFDELDDSYHEAWQPYLAAPLNAVWNGIRASRDASLPLQDGLSEEAEEDLVRKLQRARTETQRTSVASKIAEDHGYLVVRFVGGVNQMVTQDPSFAPHPTELDAVLVQEPHDWARAYQRMAREAELPKAAIHLADKSLEMIRRDAEGEYGPSHRVERTAAWSLAIKADALCDLGKFDEAAQVGADLLAKDPDDYLSFRFRLAAIHVAAGGSRQALSLLKRMSKDEQPQGPMAWTRALVLTAFGPDAERDAALDEAMRIAPGVADRLLDPEVKDRELWLETDAPRDVDYIVTGMVRDGWNVLKNGGSVLKAAVRRVKAGRGAPREAVVSGRPFSYEILPYSNAEFEKGVAGNRLVGYTSMPCEKAPDGHMAMRSDAPVDVMTFLDMDPGVASIDPTPCLLRIEHKGRAAQVVPDARVRTIAGDEWYVLVANPADTWPYAAAVAAFAEEGHHLMVVRPDLATSPLIRGTHFPQSRARLEGIKPALGHAIARVVADSPDPLSIREVALRLEADQGVMADPDVTGYLDQFPKHPRSELFKGWIFAKIFRAVREGYVDHDPIDEDRGVTATLHPRHAMLDSHDTVAALLPYMVAGNAKTLTDISRRALEVAKETPLPPATPEPVHGSAWEAALAEWSPFAEPQDRKTIQVPKMDDYPTDLEAQRAGDKVPGLLLATYAGVSESGEPWKAFMRKGERREHQMRLEIGEGPETRWGTYEIEPYFRRKSWSINVGAPDFHVAKGSVHLGIRADREWYCDKDRRGGRDLENRDMECAETAASLALDQFLGVYATSLLTEIRRKVADTMVSYVRKAEVRLSEKQAKVDELREELSGLVEALPESLRRRLAGKDPYELSQAKDYPVDTVLGVLLVTPSADGESLTVKPTGRRSAFTKLGTLGTFRDGPIEVGKAGSIENASFSGCSRASGEQHLCSAVIRFVRETPGAFGRAAVADCAQDLLKASESLRQASLQLEEYVDSLDTNVRKMEALREEFSGIPGTEAVVFPISNPCFPREAEEVEPEPVSLW